MTETEWESLCDGCARCCLIKLEDVDSGEIATTNLVCKLLDIGQCRCSDYKNRSVRVPDCHTLTPKLIGELSWLPTTCAYRVLDEGGELAWWHPLVSGRSETVHEAGISVRRYAMSEERVPEDRWGEYVMGIEKPGSFTPPKIEKPKQPTQPPPKRRR
jgi:uncharacterized protein